MVAFDPNTGLLPCVAELEGDDAVTAIGHRICAFAFGGACDCEHRARNAGKTGRLAPGERLCETVRRVAEGVLVLARAYERRQA